MVLEPETVQELVHAVQMAGSIHADDISSWTKNGGSRNGGSRTMQVQEPLGLELIYFQFMKFICSRTTVQELYMFMNLSS